MEFIRTVGDLLDFAVGDSSVLDRGHRAVWRAISKFRGEEPVTLAESDDIRLRNLYSDQPSRRMRFPAFRDLFGIDPVLAEVGEYFRMASAGGEEMHQVPAIGGPHGCGKTTVARRIAAAMEQCSFYSLADCPYHEAPLHTVSRDKREKYFEQFFPFDGELCAICEERLQTAYANDWRKMRVVRRNYRLSAGFGMLLVENSLPDAKNAGEVPESWYSVFKRANGGALFIDLSSQDAQPKEFRSMVGSLVTDGVIRTEDQTEVHLDIAIVSISNKHLLEESGIGALGDRIIPIKFHLPLDVASESKIHHRARAHKDNDFHFIPGVEDVLYRMEVASRLEPSQGVSLTLSPEDALLFYGGGAKLAEDKKSLVRHTYKELREKRPYDGATGLTVREAGIIRNKMGQYQSCIGIQHVLSMLRDPALYRGKDNDVKKRMEAWVVFDSDAKGNYALGKMEEWYRAYLKRDLIRGWIGFKRFEEMKEQYFKDYINHALHFTMKQKILDSDTNQEVPVDEKMMRLVESALRVSESEKGEVRGSIVAFFRDPKEPLENHMPLNDAIEQVIMFAKKDGETHAKAEEVQDAMAEKPQDPQKARKKLDFAMAELLEHGYQPCCWENVKSYAKRCIFN